MRREQVNKLFWNKSRSKAKVFAYVLLAVLSLVLGGVLLSYYVAQNQPTYLSYQESGDVDYEVNLKSNDFYDSEVLSEGRQYIASLIKTINAKFRYDLAFSEKETEYKYSYYIKSMVEVADSASGKVIFNKDEILAQIEPEVSRTAHLEISKDLELDYDYYNDLISKFVKVYDLNNAKSVLKVGMYVSVKGACDELSRSDGDEPVILFTIPLTKNTTAVDIVSNAKNGENKVVSCGKTDKGGMYLAMAVILGLGAALLLLSLARYIHKTRSARDVYAAALRKILNHYHPYIQKVDNSIDLRGYQVLKIGDFTDMLEIHDTLQSPILMLESKKKNSTYFLILGHAQKIAYTYTLKIQETKIKISEKD